MEYVFFKLKPDLSEEASPDVLERVNAIPGLSAAALVKPGAKREEARRHCFAIVADDADAIGLLRQLRATPGVESADLPAPRYLAAP